MGVVAVGAAEADIVFELNTRNGALSQRLACWPQRQNRQGHQKSD